MSVEYKSGIGEKIRRQREERGWSQKELAEKADVSPSTISKAEAEVFTPSPDKLQKIADALGIKLHEFLDPSADMEVIVLIDLMKIFVERGEYQDALRTIENLNNRTDLVEHQRIEISLAQADCLTQTGNNRAAIDILHDLRQTLESKKADDFMLATVLNKLGGAYFRELSIADAYAHYVRAHQLTKSFPVFDELTAKILYNLGQVYNWMRNPVEAKSCLQAAEDFFRNISDHKKLADTLFANGLVYQQLDQMERAERNLREALALYSSQNFLLLAQRVKYQLASLVTSKVEPMLAIRELYDCAAMFKETNDMPRFIYTHATIAQIYLEEGKLEEAERNLQVAFEAFPSKEYAEHTNNAYLYRVQAQCLLKAGAYKKSVEFSFKSSEYFGKMRVHREAADSLEIAIEAYEILGKKDEAIQLGKNVRDLLRCSLDKSFFQQEV